VEFHVLNLEKIEYIDIIDYKEVILNIENKEMMLDIE